MIVQHHKPECPVEKWDYCDQSQGHSEGSNVSECPDDNFWTTDYFVTKRCKVIQHHKPEYHAEKLVQCLMSRSQQGLI